MKSLKTGQAHRKPKAGKRMSQSMRAVLAQDVIDMQECKKLFPINPLYDKRGAEFRAELERKLRSNDNSR